MSMTKEHPVVTRRPVATRERLALVVAAGSLFYGVLGTLWAFGLGGFPFGPMPPDMDKSSTLSFLPTEVSAGIVAVFGLLGTVAAVAMRRTDWSPSVSRPLLAIAVAQFVLFGVLAPDLGVVTAVGYLLVLLGIPALLGVLLFGALRHRATGILLLAVALVLTVIEVTTGVFDWSAFRQLGSGLASVPGRVGFRPFLVLGSAALAAGWVVLGIRMMRAARARCRRCGRPGASWTRPESAARWGFWATIVAVICPMPYALLRYTWLLPNPIGFDADELRAEPGMRLFGLGLGTIALAAGLVCLGLIRPWGEIWPRWVPWLAGRPVPMKAVVIPGGIAATVLCLGSLPMITMFAAEGMDWETIKLLLIFPFPVWGASVGLATLAYYYRRRTPCSVCTSGAGLVQVLQ
jgi:hypothetical protein